MPPPTTATKPLAEVRADFPILSRERDGLKIAYLDSAATSQKPTAVIEAASEGTGASTAARAAATDFTNSPNFLIQPFP